MLPRNMMVVVVAPCRMDIVIYLNYKMVLPCRRDMLPGLNYKMVLRAYPGPKEQRWKKPAVLQQARRAAVTGQGAGAPGAG